MPSGPGNMRQPISKTASLISFSVKGASSKLESCKLRPLQLRPSQINSEEILVPYNIEKKLRISSTISFSVTRVFPFVLTKEEKILLLLRAQTHLWKKLDLSKPVKLRLLNPQFLLFHNQIKQSPSTIFSFLHIFLVEAARLFK